MIQSIQTRSEVGNFDIFVKPLMLRPKENSLQQRTTHHIVGYSNSSSAEIQGHRPPTMQLCMPSLLLQQSFRTDYHNSKFWARKIQEHAQHGITLCQIFKNCQRQVQLPHSKRLQNLSNKIQHNITSDRGQRKQRRT